MFLETFKSRDSVKPLRSQSDTCAVCVLAQCVFLHSVCSHSVWSCSWLGRPCAQAGCWSKPPLRAAGSAVRLCPGPPCPRSIADSPLLRELRLCHSWPASLPQQLPSASAQMMKFAYWQIRHKLSITHSCYVASSKSLIIMKRVDLGQEMLINEKNAFECMLV